MFPIFAPRYNRKSLKLTTAPATEPVSLADAKLFLRVDGSGEDSLITLLIKSARGLCEAYTQRSFISQTWTLSLDGFATFDPEFMFPGKVQMPTNYVTGQSQFVDLGRGPIQSVTSVTTYDSANNSAVFSTANYRLDKVAERLVLNDGCSWPTALRDQDAVEIVFVTGYGDAANVPPPVQQAILQTIAAMYEDRKVADMPDGAKTLLQPFCAPGAYTRL